MSIVKIATRYAKSLIELSKEQGKLERLMEDVEAFNDLMDIRDFYLLMKSPVVKGDKKWAITKSILDNKFDPLTMAFLKILINKGREPYLPEIGKEFIRLYRVEKKISVAKVTTAEPLSKASMEQIRQTLLKSSTTSDHVELSAEVDPSLIGGFVIEYDDKLYDASVKHKLEVLKKEFKDNLYISQIISR